MVDSIVNAFVDFFKNDIPAELIAFVISLFPVLEIRGGMIAARLLEIDFLKAFIICNKHTTLADICQFMTNKQQIHSFSLFILNKYVFSY